MSYYFTVSLSLLIFAIGIGATAYLAWRSHKKKSKIKPFYIFITCVFLSAVILFLPSSKNPSDNIIISWVSSVLAAIHTAIRLFVVDFDFESINAVAASLPTLLKNIYTLWGTILIVLSPILTAGAALSFFANVSARNKYFVGFWKDAYIFSELNEFSLSLAKSLKIKNPRRMVVFTDVYEKQEEASAELLERAKKLDSIIFKSDITAVNFRWHSKKRRLYFFIIGSNDEENLNQTAALTAKHEPWYLRLLHAFKKRSADEITDGYDYNRGDTRLYLFTTSYSSEMQLRTLKTQYIKVRRVNEKQSLIYHLLNDHGMQIFESAKETGESVYNAVSGENDPEKRISAVIIGLGTYGTEMLRGLAWFGQMHPYRVEITAFDSRINAADVFRSGYPELFDFDPTNPDENEEKKNGKKFHNGDFETPGESHYQITIRSGIDVKAFSFDQTISQLKDTTYVFVSLGDDDTNVYVATKLRMLFRREGIEPVIHAIIYNPTKQKMLLEDYQKGEKEENRNLSLRILPFGSIAYRYSENCILNSDIEHLALARHMEYTYKDVEERGLVGKDREAAIRAGEESFWGNDYNYRSSVASAIHKKFKVALGIPGIDKKPLDRTPAEREFCAIMEHQRWNAYVRSEGYVKADSRDKLIKTHHLLVPFEELPLSEKIKDDD